MDRAINGTIRNLIPSSNLTMGLAGCRLIQEITEEILSRNPVETSVIWIRDTRATCRPCVPWSRLVNSFKLRVGERNTTVVQRCKHQNLYEEDLCRKRSVTRVIATFYVLRPRLLS